MLIFQYKTLLSKSITISKYITIHLYLYSTMQPQLFIPTYLKNTYQYKLNTKISQIKDNKILFQDTIFHPQGGGQPKDKGWINIVNGNNGNDIENKRQIINAAADKQTGKIWNEVNNIQGLKVGDQVIINVDEEIRKKHAKLHSAGHIIDLAVQRLGYGWETAKGYHFEDGPYVEYKGPNENLQDKAKQLNDEIKKILNSNISTVKEHYSYEQAVSKQLIPKIIKFAENSCPCGGTHIEKTDEIKKLQINKLAKKGKFLRANYIVE